MDVEGSNVRRVTFAGDYNDGAAWSADGTRIAYASRAERNRFDLAVPRPGDPGQPDASPAGRAATSRPSFSPDGRRIAFSSTRAGGTQIFVIDARSGGYGRAADLPGQQLPRRTGRRTLK